MIKDVAHVACLLLYGLLIAASLIISLCLLAVFTPAVMVGHNSVLRQGLVAIAIVAPILHFWNRRFSWKSVMCAALLLSLQAALIAAQTWLYP
ncbi:hypothetical protein SAMN05518849_13921 [Sphingobium sp. AP50]|uniref:hypothetical protein n=1 Tax=Sphingobium sp. AP50 TaxID=1884369 RepID=UPI0008CAD01C|nr:hypothetical protein [Sphingobium sp. AP50]SEK05905.1 hypothetical protein SAMN05518849_13921 [Sphingobium sp. AP50]